MVKPLIPHDNTTYLCALARLIGQDLDHLCSTVENQYTHSAITQPG